MADAPITPFNTKAFSLPQTVRFKGVFDFQELYDVVKEWMESRGYEMHETRYVHKYVIPIAPEIEIDWRAWRRVTEYYMYEIQLHWHLWDIEEVEVEMHGQKKKLMRARLLVRVIPVITTDYSGRFSHSKTGQLLVNFLSTHMFYRKWISKWEDQLRFTTYELQNIIKGTLKMQAASNESLDMWTKGTESNVPPTGFYK